MNPEIYRLRIAFLFLAALLFFNFGDKKSKTQGECIADISLIDYPQEYNYRQISTYCGPFSTAACVRVKNEIDVDSFEFTDEIGWKLFDWGTLPIGLKRQLKKNDLEVEILHLSSKTEEARLHILQRELMNQNPIILLGEKHNYQHSSFCFTIGFDI